MIKDMEKGMSVIQTGTSMRGNLNEARLMEREFIIGLEVKFTTGNGKME